MLKFHYSFKIGIIKYIFHLNKWARNFYTLWAQLLNVGVSLERSIRLFRSSYTFWYLILNFSEVEEHVTSKEILLFNPLSFHELHNNWTLSSDHHWTL